MINPDEQVEFNGQMMAIKDVPDRQVRMLLGYGHTRDGREVIAPPPGHAPWPGTPETCLATDNTPQNPNTEWLYDETLLACIGCGLDVT